MAGMACSLFDEVEQDPPNCAALGIRKPRLLGKRHTAPQVVDFAYHCIGSGAGLTVLPEDAGQCLVVQEDKTRLVVVERRFARRYLLNTIGPSPFCVVEVLDEPP